VQIGDEGLHGIRSMSATAPTSNRNVPSRTGRAVAIWLLSGCVGAIAAAVLVLARRLPAPAGHLQVPWWVLALAFFVAECAVVRLHFRRELHTVSPGEVPLVLGLYAVSPLALVLVQLGGMGAGLLACRRQRPSRVALNLAQTALGSTLAIVLFRSIVAGGDPYAPRGWLAGSAAAVVTTLTGIVLGGAAVTILRGRSAIRHAPGTGLMAVLGSLTAASIALAAAVLADARPAAVALLLLPTGASALALRAYALGRRRHDHVQSLFDSIRPVGDAPDLDSAVRQLLLSARRLLRAEYSELLILTPGSGDQPLRSSIGPAGEVLMEPTEVPDGELAAIDASRSRGGAIMLARDTKSKPLRALGRFAAERGLKDLILTTLEGENGLVGVLVVGNRADDISTFGVEDEQLFRTFAGHAAVLLENEQLEQSLAKLTRLEAKLRHQALHDALTGLPNRRLFHARVDQALGRAASDGSQPVVLYLDLDGFKAINDDLGHTTGDELLVAFSERLRGSVRPDELPARLGGDEFAVLIEDGGVDVAEDVARRLTAAARDPFSIQGRRLSLRLSIGIASARGSRGVEELLANADLAMYAAKSDGGSGYALYSERMHGSAESRRALRIALEDALERDQIAVYYQPVVDLRSGRTVAFEALARWRRGRADTVPAAEFLPVAEEDELIERIGEVVLRAACLQTQEWRADPEIPGELSVYVNLSPAEFANPRLGSEVASALLDTGLDSSRLILEITERVATIDPQATLATMTELRRLGVRFALDEFGTGRTSLEQLCQLPFAVVKIARPLVDRIGGSPADERVTRGIVGLSRSLGLRVVAAGIESKEQAVRIEQLGCHFGQGFYFDHALGVPQATRRLRSSAARDLSLAVSDTA
jgi:diguanylate cyclase (GGDEF)-like protein